MRQVAQMALMAAIVATMLYLPVGAVLALLLGIAGVPLDGVITFGGALGTFAGVVAWWAIFFALAMVYAAIAFPWSHTQGFTEE